MDEYTRKFDFVVDQDAEIHRIMLTVYQALEEKGYNPINQIVGYILSEDPTYITNHNQARTLIRKVDRDELMQATHTFYRRAEKGNKYIILQHLLLHVLKKAAPHGSTQLGTVSRSSACLAGFQSAGSPMQYPPILRRSRKQWRV